MELGEFLTYFMGIALVTLWVGIYYYIKRKQQKHIETIWHRVDYEKYRT